MSSDQQSGTSLQTRLQLFFGLAFLFVIAFNGLLTLFGIPFTEYAGMMGTLEERAYKSLSDLADVKKAALGSWISERRADARVFADAPLFRKTLRSVLESSPTSRRELLAEARKEIHPFLRTIRRSYRAYEKIQVAEGVSGEILFSTDPSEIGGSVASTPGFAAVLRPFQRESMHFQREGAKQNLYFCITHSIEAGLEGQPASKQAGLILLYCNVEMVLKPILHTGIGLGGTGEVVIVDRHSRLLTPLRFPMPNGLPALPLEFINHAQPSQLAAAGVETLITAEDYRGVPVLAATRYLNVTSEMGWGLEIKMDLDEVYAPLRRMLLGFSVAAICSLFLLLFLTVTISRRLSAPIRELSRSASRIKEGRFEERSTASGFREVRILAETFNSMAEQLETWRAELESKIRERTAELSSLTVDLQREKLALAASEEKYRELVEQTGDLITRVDAEGRFTYVNPASTVILGVASDELVGTIAFDIIHPDDREHTIRWFRNTLERRLSQCTFENRLVNRQSGAATSMLWTCSCIFDTEGKLLSVNSIARDITGLRKAEQDLQRITELYSVLSQANQANVRAKNRTELFQQTTSICSTTGRFDLAWIGILHETDQTIRPLASAGPASAYLDNITISAMSADISGRGPTGTAFREGCTIIVQDWEKDPTITPWRQKACSFGIRASAAIPISCEGKPTAVLTLYSREPGFFRPDRVQLLEGMVKDLGFALEKLALEERRTAAEKEREKLQSQLVQSQKMESIGRLAGGIAHDFNNMLMVITGTVELALESCKPGDNLEIDLKEIHKAAKRSAEITRQLLAFARKQTIAPKVLDLNETVEGMLKMLRRLIGEDIELLWKPGRIGNIRIDPSQVDQILANLVANARDSIAGTGTITIGTFPQKVDESMAQVIPGASPGGYAVLSITDTGSGMDQETLTHLFEPFFTTKALGHGTGLGLATVYGIVRQNEGFIDVRSTQGLGTTFTLYLPTFQGVQEKVPVDSHSALPRGKGERILLVEDEPELLGLCQKMLEKLGYSVSAAPSHKEAVAIADAEGEKLHLLVTDVIMPEMNGRDLSTRIAERHKGLKCLFMSGYPSEVLAHRGILDPGLHFLLKPFNLKSLAVAVRKAMDE